MVEHGADMVVATRIHREAWSGSAGRSAAWVVASVMEISCQSTAQNGADSGSVSTGAVAGLVTTLRARLAGRQPAAAVTGAAAVAGATWEPPAGHPLQWLQPRWHAAFASPPRASIRSG